MHASNAKPSFTAPTCGAVPTVKYSSIVEAAPVLTTPMLENLPFRFHLFRALLAFALAAAPLTARAQAATPQTSAAPAPATSANPFNPTRPEAQPSLMVDRDPVPSPDVAVAAPAPSAGGTSSTAVEKGKNGVYRLREDVNEVVQYCTVVNQKGRLVDGLTQKDFHIWEDGVPQTIESFQHGDVPVSMGILIDNSGSMRGKRAAVNQAALHLIRASNPQDAAFIVNFSDRPYLDARLTSNRAELERGLSHIDSRNMTALYDAVVASADELSAHATHPKQVLLIITDGADDASRYSLQQAVARVQRLGGPVVYSIGLLYDEDRKDAAVARDALDELSNDTGGLAYFPSSLEDVDAIAAQVAQDVRDQYTLGYHSTKPASEGGYRSVRVEAEAPKQGKLIVRTRKGYYRRAATPAQTQIRAVAVTQQK